MRRYAELQPVFAGSFRVVSAVPSTSAPGPEVMMAAVVAMPAALGIFARLQVAHWNFLRRNFAHTIPFFSQWLGCVQLC